MKFSIIIPVYNVEEYVGDCLLSCLNQDYDKEDYEIIVVNDGSPDKSLEVVKSISKGHQNVTIISQENKGLSGARNTGLKVARGEFVWFVDSDDWINLDSLKILSEYCNNGIELVTFCAADVLSENNYFIRNSKSDIEKKVTSGIVLMSHPSWQPPVWLNIYRRSFLIGNELYMMEGILHEDAEFEPRAYYFAKKAVALDKVLYYVRINPESISRSINPKRAFDLLKVANSLENFKNKSSNPIAKKIISGHISFCLNVSFSNYSLMNKDDKAYFFHMMNNCKYLMRNFRDSNMRKHKLQYFMYLISPNFAFYLRMHISLINLNSSLC